MRTVAIVQARMGSTRLPGKVLADLGGRPMLALMLGRLRRCGALDDLRVATSTLTQDDPVADLCGDLGVSFSRGPEDDVLERFRLAAEGAGADIVVRLTADCPFICPEVVERVVSAFRRADPGVDYASNTLRRTFPRGLDTEVVSRCVLDLAAREAVLPPDREHVTRFIWRKPDRFRLLGVEDAEDLSCWHWTVDTPEDLRLISTMVAALGHGALAADYGRLKALYAAHPEWHSINASVDRKTS